MPAKNPLTTSLSAELFTRLNFGETSSSLPPVDVDVHLPDACVRSIAAFLLAGEPPGHALIHLLAFAGTCRQWRAVAREVSAGVCIGYDVLDNTFCSLPSIQKFRRLSPTQKEEVRRVFVGWGWRTQ